MVLTLPALWNGWQLDDYFHQDALSRSENVWDITFTLFTFWENDVTATQAAIESGILPWWTLPDAYISFWRPLSAITHWLDYRLWPDQPALMHTHSWLWWGAVVWLVALLYRRVWCFLPDLAVDSPHSPSPQPSPQGRGGSFSPPLGGGEGGSLLAAILYAVDEAHGFPIGWLANRNTILAAFFGFLTLLLYDKWRREAWSSGAWLVPLCLLLGLLSAEATIAIFGYLLAYALFLDGRYSLHPQPRSFGRGAKPPSLGEGLRGGFAALSPSALIIILWQLAYQTLGYGTWGTAYANPTQEPLRFLTLLIERGPILLLGQLTPIPAEFYNFLPALPATIVWISSLFLFGGFIWLCLPLLRVSALARFFAAGMIFSLIPACVILPANRLLFFVGFGAMGLMTLLVQHDGKRLLTPKKPTLLAIRALIFCHLIIAPILLPFTTYSPSLLGDLPVEAATLPNDPHPSTQTFVIVNAPSAFHPALIPTLRQQANLPALVRIRLLSATIYPIEIERVSEQSLLIRPQGGYLLGFDSVFRGDGHNVQLNKIILLPDLTIRVTALTGDGRPAEALFRFAAPLEDSTLAWYVWQQGRYEPFSLPEIGTRMRVPGVF